MQEMSDSYFYPTGERPLTVHPRQADVVEYIFERRPREMHFQADPSGKTESKWAACTKQSVFLPLFDPRSEMNTMYQSRDGYGSFYEAWMMCNSNTLRNLRQSPGSFLVLRNQMLCSALASMRA